MPAPWRSISSRKNVRRGWVERAKIWKSWPPWSWSTRTSSSRSVPTGMAVPPSRSASAS
ncbi:hypothetical protein ACFQ0M_42480 [Kitasatospora aburaviensis]